MTAGSSLRTEPDRRSRPMVVEVEGGTLSGRETEPAGRPRGVLIALHGGGSRAAYFDSPAARESSLLELAADVGWRCIALDRPGYGDSAALRERRLDSAGQAELLRDVVVQLSDGLPLVLVGHSLGAITALRLAHMLAQRPDGNQLLGVAAAGAPLVYTPEQRVQIAGADVSGPTLRRGPGQHRRPPEEWLGPAGSYPAALRDDFTQVVQAVPSGEMPDAQGAPELISQLLQGLCLPVQFAVAEHEMTMAPAGEVLARAAQVMPRVPGSERLEVGGSGHNVSLSNKARAYHLRVLSFAEQLLAEKIAGATSDI